MEFLTKEVAKLGTFSLLVWHIIVAVAVIALLVVLIVVLCKAGKKKQTAQQSQPTTDATNIDDTDDDQVDEVIVTIEGDTTDDEGDIDQQVDQEPTDVPTDDNTDQPKKPRVKNYHISLRPDGKWQVKLSKGDRAIKLFKTQAEAIAFAKSRAKSQDGHITIHKVDGKIRKQKY